MTQPDHGAAPAVAPTGDPVAGAPGPAGGRVRLEGRPISAAVLLPLRVFLGVTYLYAGIDKLVSPHFFTAGDPLSVAGQMEGYLRASPLAPLIEAALPAAMPIGVLIALAELAIGIGLLTGLAYRAAAWTGFGLSLLFWLTASWSVVPYYFSPDLPYAVGFLTLALAGHGHLLVIDPWPSKGDRGRTGRDADAEADADAATTLGAEASEASARPGAVSAGRRALLEVGILAAMTILTAGAVSRLRALGASETAAGGSAPGTPPPTPAATPGPTPAATSITTAAPATAPVTAAPATAAPTGTPPPVPTPAATAAAATGPVIASVTDLQPNAGLPFTVPNEMPFALGPGGPGVLVELPDGRFVAYSAVCTHGRCTVAYDPAASELVCPCHAGRFDPAASAAVLGGPPPLPLPEIPIEVDGSGQIHAVLEG